MIMKSLSNINVPANNLDYFSLEMFAQGKRNNHDFVLHKFVDEK